MTFNRPDSGDDVNIAVNIVANEQKLKRSDAAVKGFKKSVDRLEQGFDRSAKAALAMEKRQAQLAKQTKESASLTQRWTAELAKVEQQRAVEAISRDFVKAIKDGKDLENQIIKIEARLKAVGATEGQVSAVLARGAGAGTGAQALQAFGREARLSLPAVQIPGTGVGSESVFRAAEILGRLGASLKSILVVGGPVVAIIGGLALALGESNRQFIEGKEAALETLDAESRLALLRESGSKSQIEAAKAEAQERQETALAAIEAAEAQKQQIEDTSDAQRLAEIKLRATLQTSTDLTAQQYRAVGETLDEQIPIAEKATQEISKLNTLLKDTGLQARFAAEGQQEAFEAGQQRRLQNVLANATQDNLALFDDQLNALKAQKEALADFIQTENLSEEQTKALGIQYVELHSKVAQLSGAIRDEVEIRDRERQAREFQKQQLNETVAAMEQHNARIETLTNQRAEREAAILGKLNDNIIRIAEKAALDAERALERLEQQRDKLNTGLARGERDATRRAQLEDLENRVKFQREEAKSFRDHLRELRDIREDAQAQEEELGRDRDFAGLRRLRLETNRNLRDQNRAFTEQQAEREAAFTLEIQDEQRRREFERESRLIRFNDAMKDAQEQFERQQALIARNEQRALVAQRNASLAELKLNNEKHRAALSMQHQATSAELSIVAQGQAARLEMERRHQQALIAQANALRIANFFGNLGQNIVGGLTGNTNNINTTFNVAAGGSRAQTRSLEAIVDSRIADALGRIG